MDEGAHEWDAGMRGGGKVVAGSSGENRGGRWKRNRTRTERLTPHLLDQSVQTM